LINPPTPAQQYARHLANGDILPDQAQEVAVAALDAVCREMTGYWQRPRGFLQILLHHHKGRKHLEKTRGLYLWGGVGRGKTFLMDVFFHCLPGERKLRMHFHRFMQLIHQRLNANKGARNPLELVAGEICEQADVLCFDEFFVSDIGDAMILGNLLEAMFARGIVLVTTSNIEPARLYERGLQRQKFLPAIALLEKHTRVLNVDGGTDYRLRTLEDAGIFHFPLGMRADQAMSSAFTALTRGLEEETDREIEILGRVIPVNGCIEGVAWFSFRHLCGGPRSAADYIEISQLFHTVLLSDVPVFDESRDDEARRFISMVDEFYDRRVKLVMSAQAPLKGLYQGTELAFPFERTVSRLLEMQSREYLGLEHHQD